MVLNISQVHKKMLMQLIQVSDASRLYLHRTKWKRIDMERKMRVNNNLLCDYVVNFI